MAVSSLLDFTNEYDHIKPSFLVFLMVCMSVRVYSVIWHLRVLSKKKKKKVSLNLSFYRRRQKGKMKLS